MSSTVYKVGSIGLTGINSQGFISRLIKFGAWVGRYPPAARRFSHAFLVVDADGTIAEAVKKGVRTAHISKYDPADIQLVELDLDPRDAEQVRAFALDVLEHRWRYAFLTFAACGLNCLTGQIRWLPTLSFALAQTAICSGFVCDALTRAGFIWAKPPAVMMPADLALHFQRA